MFLRQSDFIDEASAFLTHYSQKSHFFFFFLNTIAFFGGEIQVDTSPGIIVVMKALTSSPQRRAHCLWYLSFPANPSLVRVE